MSRDIWYFEEWLDFVEERREVLSVAVGIILIALFTIYLIGV